MAAPIPRGSHDKLPPTDNLMKLALTFLAIAACVAALPAQTKAPKARQFLLDDYTSVMSIDMKKMRDSGVWDEMSSSALKMIFGMMEKQFGFSLDALDRATMVREYSVDGEVTKSCEILTVEGNADLGQLADVQHGRYVAAVVGDYTVMLDQWGGDQALVQVTPTLRVMGPTDLLKDVLNGKPRAGLPSGDVMSFTAGQKGLLGYAIGDLRSGDIAHMGLDVMLPDAAWPEDDKPTFVCIRLVCSGDEDDPHLTLEWLLRHGKDGAGLVASEKAVASALNRVRELKEARIVRPLLKKITHERDRTDAIWRLDLGRARDAAGMLGMLSPFLMVSRAAEVQVIQAGQIIVEEVVEEVVEAQEEKAKPKPVEKKAKVIEVTRKPPKKAKLTPKPKPATGGGSN